MKTSTEVGFPHSFFLPLPRPCFKKQKGVKEGGKDFFKKHEFICFLCVKEAILHHERVLNEKF